MSTDQNRSVASIRVTATGSAIRDFSDLQLDDVIETEFSQVTSIFLKKRVFSKVGSNLVLARRTGRFFFCIVFGLMSLGKESVLTM